MQHYEVLFYNGWIEPPAYYLLDAVGGETPEQSLAKNLNRLIDVAREKFSLEETRSSRIRESLYIVREGGMFSARER